MPIDLRLSERERAAQVASARLVVEAALPLGAKGVPAGDHELDAPAVVVPTSGTSGAPKPVELTYGNWLWSAMGSAVALGLDREERWLCPLPLSHVGGLSVLLRSAIYGTTAVLHPGFDADAVARALGGDAVTGVSLVPTMVGRLLDAGLDHPPTLRCALVGGAALEQALARRAHDAGLPVVETYGLTEACSQVATDGVPLFGTRVAIEDGEILVAGPTVAPGAAGEDGVLRTGDLGFLDERGRLTVSGRRADTIVTGGENVSPAEVEAALLEHAAVAEAAVYPRPDPEWGEAVTATVVLRGGAATTEQELRDHVAARLARFKVPKSVGFADGLPRTASGKLKRGDL
jgi:O-succinylbenzoic acid--CoA ligase